MSGSEVMLAGEMKRMGVPTSNGSEEEVPISLPLVLKLLKATGEAPEHTLSSDALPSDIHEFNSDE